MNRWQAITHIVSVFVDRGHPGYALCALALNLISGIAIAAFAYAIGAPVLELLG